MFDPERYLNSLRSRPEQDRVLFAFIGSGIITGIIFLIWITIFFYNMRHTSTVRVQPVPVPTQSNNVQNVVDSVLNSEEPFNPLPSNTTQGDDLPVQLIDTPQETQN